jgi:hypothetical protein
LINARVVVDHRNRSHVEGDVFGFEETSLDWVPRLIDPVFSDRSDEVACICLDSPPQQGSEVQKSSKGILLILVSGI